MTESEVEERLKRFLSCGLAAQKAADEIIAQSSQELALEAAAKKVSRTGSRKDLQAYLKLRRNLL